MRAIIRFLIVMDCTICASKRSRREAVSASCRARGGGLEEVESAGNWIGRDEVQPPSQDL